MTNYLTPHKRKYFVKQQQKVAIFHIFTAYIIYLIYSLEQKTLELVSFTQFCSISLLTYYPSIFKVTLIGLWCKRRRGEILHRNEVMHRWDTRRQMHQTFVEMYSSTSSQYKFVIQILFLAFECNQNQLTDYYGEKHDQIS